MIKIIKSAFMHQDMYVLKFMKQDWQVNHFVADMSTGFSCNLGYSMPKNWAFDQFCELNSFSSSPSFPLDKDAYSGRDTGFKKFDAVSTKTDEEIAQENLRAKVKIARNQYVYNVMEPLGYLNKIMDVGVEY